MHDKVRPTPGQGFTGQTETFDLPIRDPVFGDHTLRVQWIRSGEPRPTLVFLHDSLGSITVWRDFPRRLAETAGYDALVYDRRGYGRSSPFPAAPRTPRYLEDEGEALLRLLDALDVREAALFGHSDGGSIALVAAARDPSRFPALITEGAHVFVEERTLAGIRQAREALATTDLRDRLWRHHGDNTDGVTSAWIDTWLSPAFRDWSIERHLPSIVSPLLVLQGVDDEFGTAKQVETIVAGVSGRAQSLLIPGAAHTPHREATEETLRVCAAFLAG